MLTRKVTCQVLDVTSKWSIKSKVAIDTETTDDKEKRLHDFYQTKEWKALRYDALVKYGNKCQCCGREPPNVILHVDHIEPIRHFWEKRLELKNLQILCADCNRGKSSRDNTDWRKNSSIS